MPQPRIIRTAILKMDNAVLNYEAIEVLPHLLFTSLIHFLSFPFLSFVCSVYTYCTDSCGSRVNEYCRVLNTEH